MGLANKTVLVTGASGFLGGALALRLAEDSTHVKALVRNPRKADFLRGHDLIDIVQGDITDAARMVAVSQGCDVVLHAAAALGGPMKHQQSVNAEGTRNVMNAAATAKVARVVHVSSIAVYGYRYESNVTEAMPMCPSAEPYSITKSMAEDAVQEVGARQNLSFSIIRSGLIYGPRSQTWTRKAFLLARMKPTPFFGDGSGSAHMIFVDDLIDLIMTTATYPAADRQVFNATSDPAPTWRALMCAYAQLAGHENWLSIPPALSYGVAGIAALGSPTQSQRRALPDMARFLQKRITYKMTKARELLGWEAQIDLETGVQRCAPWLRELGLLL